MIILASTSPRRIELMRQAGFEIEVVAPGSEELERRGESPRAMVKRLSQEKARAALASARPGAGRKLIVGADTTVVAPGGGRVLGKPADAADARRMLARLSGRVHEVLTGYTVLEARAGRETRAFSRVVSSRVSIRKLSRRAIERYVATGEPMDKAGSYAAQGAGMALVERLSGSYTNVVGLPMCQLIRDLEERFGVSWLDAGDGRG
jgi:septum formation protein